MAYFLADNGLLFANPFISGSGWYVVFDGDEEPELVIAIDTPSGPLDSTQARLRAVAILDECGLSAVLSGPPRRMMRAFTADGVDSRNAYCFWLVIQSPIPAELCPTGAGVKSPPCDAPVFSFGHLWGDDLI